MARRLENYYIFCNTCFYSQFREKNVKFVLLKEMNLSDHTSRKFPIYKLEISDLFCACILAELKVQFA